MRKRVLSTTLSVIFLLNIAESNLLAQPVLQQQLEQVPELDTSLFQDEQNLDLLQRAFGTTGGREIWDEIANSNEETQNAAIFNHFFKTQQVLEPEIAVENLKEKLKVLDADCKEDEIYCDDFEAVKGAVEILEAGKDKWAACGDAVKKFRTYYSRSDAPPSVSKEFDFGCLGSVEPRKTGLAVEATDPALPIFSQGGKNKSNKGILSAVALLENPHGYFCSGLLRPDGTLVTAKHCFDGKRKSFKENKVWARSVSTSDTRWKLEAKPVSKPTSNGPNVADDWIVLKLETSDPPTVANSTMVRWTPKRPITLLGYFSYFEQTEYADNASNRPWRRALRYPRPNLCAGISISEFCLEMACETIRGFSGSPIFLADEHEDGEPLKVVGFVSGPNSREAGCSGMLEDSTFAVNSSIIE